MLCIIKSEVRQPNREQAGRSEKEEAPWEADSRPRGGQCLPEAGGREH